MSSMRTWSWSASGVLLGATLLLAACTQEPEPAQQPAPQPAAQAPAAPAQPAPGQPAPGQPAAQPAAPQAAPGQPAAGVIDELYVDAEAEPDEGPPPLTVKFTTTVEDNTGAVTCEWDFGDHTPKVTELNPSHVYKEEGDFVAVVTCKDSKGIEGETEVDVTAYEY